MVLIWGKGIMLENEKVNLKEYINAQIVYTEKLFETRIQALEKTTSIAASQMEKRLESMNEFRQQLKDQSNTFVTRNEHQFVLDDIRSLRDSRNLLVGKANQEDVNKIKNVVIIGIVISIIGSIVEIVGFFTKVFN
jgi:outer membrane PBP1 activator LpoA protein